MNWTLTICLPLSLACSVGRALASREQSVVGLNPTKGSSFFLSLEKGVVLGAVKLFAFALVTSLSFTCHSILYTLSVHSKFDLYSKADVTPDVEALVPYYQTLIDKYCPGVLDW